MLSGCDHCICLIVPCAAPVIIAVAGVCHQSSGICWRCRVRLAHCVCCSGLVPTGHATAARSRITRLVRLSSTVSGPSSKTASELDATYSVVVVISAQRRAHQGRGEKFVHSGVMLLDPQLLSMLTAACSVHCAAAVCTVLQLNPRGCSMHRHAAAAAAAPQVMRLFMAASPVQRGPNPHIPYQQLVM